MRETNLIKNANNHLELFAVEYNDAASYQSFDRGGLRLLVAALQTIMIRPAVLKNDARIGDWYYLAYGQKFEICPHIRSPYGQTSRGADPLLHRCHNHVHMTLHFDYDQGAVALQRADGEGFADQRGAGGLHEVILPKGDGIFWHSRLNPPISLS